MFARREIKPAPELTGGDFRSFYPVGDKINYCITSVVRHPHPG